MKGRKIMLKVRKKATALLVVLLVVISVPVFAASHLGGEWTYGGQHTPGDWGAFSNYYHSSKYHWSYVGSTARDNQHTAYADARSTSYAFINTNIGEKVVFDAGW